MRSLNRPFVSLESSRAATVTGPFSPRGRDRFPDKEQPGEIAVSDDS